MMKRWKSTKNCVISHASSSFCIHPSHSRQQGSISPSPMYCVQYMRKSVSDDFEILGPKTFLHLYRMDFSACLCLQAKLEENFVAATYQYFTVCKTNSMSSPPIPDVPVSTMDRLACVIRYFSDGSAFDIVSIYHLLKTEVMKSVWFVVDAVNQLEEFKTKYLSYHTIQQAIASEFESASSDFSQIVPFVLMGFLFGFRNPPKNK